MMTNRKLGRGLHALLGVPQEPAVQLGIHSPEESTAGELAQIPLDHIDANPYQPRRDFEPQELQALADSISAHGVVQPIAVRKSGERFQLIAGERRLRASQLAGLASIPARILELDERQTCEVALVENLQRADLNAVEKAQAFQDYISRFGATHEELAAQLGIDRSTVTNLMRLLELPEEVQSAIRSGKISAGHARALLAIEDPLERVALCRRVIVEGLSVRQVESETRERRKSAGRAAAAEKVSSPPGAVKSNHLLMLENELQQRLGTKVEIKSADNRSGTIVLHFGSNDDFERLLARLK